jgi:hypothetical protein
LPPPRWALLLLRANCVQLHASFNQIARTINLIFIVLLKFSDNKSQASQFMEGHNEWVKRGISEDVFLLVGSLQPNMGGGILEITPSKVDERLQFLPD